MTLTFTILGCGSSMGVPRPALGWGACDPNNPKNRRRRTSLLVERRAAAGATRVLVDTSPDLREQLLGAGVDGLDGVFLTHPHADHLHGAGQELRHDLRRLRQHAQLRQHLPRQPDLRRRWHRQRLRLHAHGLRHQELRHDLRRLRRHTRMWRLRNRANLLRRPVHRPPVRRSQLRRLRQRLRGRPYLLRRRLRRPADRPGRLRDVRRRLPQRAGLLQWDVL